MSYSEKKISLSDEEWMSLIDGTREGGLTVCCANISALRDEIISIARNGGTIQQWDEAGLQVKINWVLDSHEIDKIPALVKFIEQTGIDTKQAPHKPQEEER